MKALTQKMLVGSLAVALTGCLSGILLAGPPLQLKMNWKANQKVLGSNAFKASMFKQIKKGQPGQGNKGQGGKGQGNFGQGNKGPGKKGPWAKGHGHHPKHHPWHKHRHHGPKYVYRPVIVETSPTYYEPDASNPVPLADIQLVNPPENQLTLNFRLDDGELQSLSAGYSLTINRATVITFDRGGGSGFACYTLTDGTYKFVISNGLWELVHQAPQYEQAAAYPQEDMNPVPTN